MVLSGGDDSPGGRAGEEDRRARTYGAIHHRDRVVGVAFEGRVGGVARAEVERVFQASAFDRRRIGLSSVRAAGGTAVFSVGESSLRAWEHADHDESAGIGMGNGILKRGFGDGDLGSFVASQSHVDDQRRELSIA